jgi:hypothetical protein
MADIISLGIRVETREVEQGVRHLEDLKERLNQSDARVEKLEKTWNGLDNTLRRNPLKAANDNLDKLDKQLDKTAKNTDRFKGAFDGLGQLSTRVGGAIAGLAAALGIGLGIGAVAKEVMDAEREMKALDNALRLTDQASTAAKGNMIAFADAMEQTTVYASGAVNEVQAYLTLFGKVGPDTIDRVTKATLDFAAASGKDLPSATAVMAKALANPAQAASTLREAGKGLSAEQEKLLNQIVKTGDGAKAQGVILEAFEHRFHGAADATDTLSDRLAQVQNKFNTLLEGIGSGATNPLVEVLNSASSALDYLNKNVETAQGIIAGFSVTAVIAGLAGITAGAVALAGVISPLLLAFGGIAIAAGAITGVLVATRNEIISFGDANLTVAEIATVAWDTFSGLFTAQVQGIWAVLTSGAETAADVFVGIWEATFDIFGGLFEALKTLAQGVWGAITNSFKAAGDLLAGIFGTSMDEIMNTLTGTATSIKDSFTGLINTLKEMFTGLPEHLFNPHWWANAVYAAITAAATYLKELFDRLIVKPVQAAMKMISGALTWDMSKMEEGMAQWKETTTTSFDEAGRIAANKWRSHMYEVDEATGEMVLRQSKLIAKLGEIDVPNPLAGLQEAANQKGRTIYGDPSTVGPHLPPTKPNFDPRPLKTGGSSGDQAEENIKQLEAELASAQRLDDFYRTATGTVNDRKEALASLRVEMSAQEKIANLDKDLTQAQRDRNIELINAIKGKTLAVIDYEKALERQAQSEQTAFKIGQDLLRLYGEQQHKAGDNLQAMFAKSSMAIERNLRNNLGKAGEYVAEYQKFLQSTKNGDRPTTTPFLPSIKAEDLPGDLTSQYKLISEMRRQWDQVGSSAERATSVFAPEARLAVMEQFIDAQRLLNDSLAVEAQLHSENLKAGTDAYKARKIQLNDEARISRDTEQMGRRLKNEDILIGLQRENEARKQILDKLSETGRNLEEIDALQRRISAENKVLGTGIRRTDEQFPAAVQEIERGETYDAEIDKVSNETPIERYYRQFDQVKDINEMMQESTVNTLQGMEDAFVTFAQTGELNFASMADSIIADLTRIIVKQMILMPLMQMMGIAPAGATSMFGMFGGGPTQAAKGDVLLGANDNNRGEVVNSPKRLAGGEVEVAEQYPEAIMPLTRVNGKMGVSVEMPDMPDFSELDRTINRLSMERMEPQEAPVISPVVNVPEQDFSQLDNTLNRMSPAEVHVEQPREEPTAPQAVTQTEPQVMEMPTLPDFSDLDRSLSRMSMGESKVTQVEPRIEPIQVPVPQMSVPEMSTSNSSSITVNVQMPQNAKQEDGKRFGKEIAREINQSVDSRIVKSRSPRGIMNPAILSG